MNIVEEVGDGGERLWRINWPMIWQLPTLENIAKGIEDGEIEPGAFVLRFSRADYDAIPADLRRRLGGFLKVV